METNPTVWKKLKNKEINLKSDEFDKMESQPSNVSVLRNVHQDLKIVKNVARTAMDVLMF